MAHGHNNSVIDFESMVRITTMEKTAGKISEKMEIFENKFFFFQ